MRPEHGEMARSWRAVLDNERPSRQPGGEADRVARGKYRGAEQLIPDCEGEPEIDVLSPVDAVVDAMEVRADEDPSEHPEAEPDVRVRQCDGRTIEDEKCRRQRPVGRSPPAACDLRPIVGC